jgi:2-polyprenyl-6-methoxyphenol hydroxylase-like FAD-dependent oxidoreductase
VTRVAIIGGGIGGLTAANALSRARRDLLIAVRQRVSRRDPEGRGTGWLAEYDATSPDALTA